MRNFRVPLNVIVCNVMIEKHLCWDFLLKLQTGALKLYLNEPLAQVLSCEFCFHRKPSCRTFAKGFLLFFSRFYFFLCEELQDNEDHRFSNYVNVI